MGRSGAFRGLENRASNDVQGRRIVARDHAVGEASDGEEFDDDIGDEGGAELRVK